MARIGFRNLKTALAVLISMIVSKLAGLEYPLFVAIAAIISMESSIMNSVKAGKNRMAGTLIGAAFGFGCALIRPGSAILCGIGMIGVIYCCNMLKWRKPIQIAGVVFMAIMVGLKGANPLQYSVNRIFDTFIGISVAVIVNYLIYPPDYLPRIRRAVSGLLMTTEQIIRILIRQEIACLAGYETEFIKANEAFALYCGDQRIRKRKSDADFPELQKTYHDLKQIRNHLRIVAQLNGPLVNGANTHRLYEIFGWRDFPSQESPQDETGIVYNFHIRTVLSLYERIKQRAGVLSSK